MWLWLLGLVTKLFQYCSHFVWGHINAALCRNYLAFRFKRCWFWSGFFYRFLVIWTAFVIIWAAAWTVTMSTRLSVFLMTSIASVIVSFSSGMVIVIVPSFDLVITFVMVLFISSWVITWTWGISTSTAEVFAMRVAAAVVSSFILGLYMISDVFL